MPSNQSYVGSLIDRSLTMSTPPTRLIIRSKPTRLIAAVYWIRMPRKKPSWLASVWSGPSGKRVGFRTAVVRSALSLSWNVPPLYSWNSARSRGKLTIATVPFEGLTLMTSIVSVSAWFRSWPESIPVRRIEIRSLGGAVGPGVGVGGAGVSPGASVGVGAGGDGDGPSPVKIWEPAS